MKTNNLLTTIFGKKVERDENGRLTIEGKTLAEAFRERLVNMSNRKTVVNVNKQDGKE